jgi:hypothetical protein
MDVETLRSVEQETGLCFPRGKFSEPERAIIRQTLSEYLQGRGLTLQDFLTAFFLSKRSSREVYTDERFKDVFHYVAQRLDGRPVMLVYQCMRRMYHPGNLKGRWTSEEDGELKRLFHVLGPDWEAIGMSLGRYGMSCRDHFRSFRNRGSSGPWTTDEVDRLKHAIEAVRGGTDGRPCWLLVSEAVATRSPAQCMSKWTSLLTISRNGGIRARFNRDLDYSLISHLYDLVVEHESEIRWREVADESWPVFFRPSMLKDRFRLLRKRVRGEKTLDMDTLLEALMLSLRPLTPDIIQEEDLEDFV